MNKDSGLRLERVLVDGAMTGNALMMQTLADFLSELPHDQTQFVLMNLSSSITFRIVRLKLGRTTCLMKADVLAHSDHSYCDVVASVSLYGSPKCYFYTGIL